MRDNRRDALDTQLWPLLAVAEPPAEWRRALACAEARLGVTDGFDFNDRPRRLWSEGTAAGSLDLPGGRRAGARPGAARSAMRQRAPSGLLYATREAQITTGLTIVSDQHDADFLYYRRPHLGATAWAVLAQAGWNPFDGKVLPIPPARPRQ